MVKTIALHVLTSASMVAQAAFPGRTTFEGRDAVTLAASQPW
jgi:hypothetical protein